MVKKKLLHLEAIEAGSSSAVGMSVVRSTFLDPSKTFSSDFPLCTRKTSSVALPIRIRGGEILNFFHCVFHCDFLALYHIVGKFPRGAFYPVARW